MALEINETNFEELVLKSETPVLIDFSLLKNQELKSRTKNLENFQKLVSNENSGWLDTFLKYKINKIC